ncbi:MAG: hypothetical protein QXY16_02305 [Nanopusillaceae archaeon]
MNKKEKVIINLLFFIFTVPIIILIIYGYNHVKQIVQKNPMNPLGLEIIDCKIEETDITFIINNPNNLSYSIVFTNLRIRGDYASPAIVTSGGFINKIISFQAFSTVSLRFPISKSDIAILNIIRTWKKLGGKITISLDYEIIPTGGSGVIICKK